jgi:hypothetical protein
MPRLFFIVAKAALFCRIGTTHCVVFQTGKVAGRKMLLRFRHFRHPWRSCTSVCNMARPERFELPTTKFVAWYSIQLSYGRMERAIMRIVRGGVNSRHLPNGWLE